MRPSRERTRPDACPDKNLQREAAGNVADLARELEPISRKAGMAEATDRLGEAVRAADAFRS